MLRWHATGAASALVATMRKIATSLRSDGLLGAEGWMRDFLLLAMLRHCGLGDWQAHVILRQRCLRRLGTDEVA